MSYTRLLHGPVRFNLLLSSPEYVSRRVIFRPLFVFLINDHPTEITVRWGFLEQIAASVLINNKNPIHLFPSSLLKGYETRGVTTCLSFCVDGTIAEAGCLIFQSSKGEWGERAML